MILSLFLETPENARVAYQFHLFLGPKRQGPKIGRNGYLTPAFSGVHRKGGQNHKWPHHPLPSRGRKIGRNRYVAVVLLGVPENGDKMTSGYITPAFSGAQDWAEWLPYLGVLTGPQKRGQNHKWPHHPCLLGGAKSARNFDATRASFSGVPKKRGQNQRYYPYHLKGPRLGGIATQDMTKEIQTPQKKLSPREPRNHLVAICKNEGLLNPFLDSLAPFCTTL